MLLEMLNKPEWTGGGRLPPETELARDIGVSRPVLRKALARLRDEGRVFSRRGSGNYVQPKLVVEPPLAEFGALTIQTVQDMKRCMRFRQIVEAAAAEDAARLQDVAAIRAIEAAHRALAELQPGGTVFDRDFAFHLAVAAASGNSYYRFALETLRQQIALGLEFGRRLRGIAQNEVSERVIAEHASVLRAIQDADPVAAREAMSLHIQQGIQRLFGDEEGGRG
ncbi:FCD domain-containing protein (plasmid) [Salipiger sp. H15]|uniref:FCD domain-containing protein n=1 Tax=Alloyangia sp. H15 TaxID=3029062 RepID=A0AAU8AQI9_9RHOB